MFVQGLRQRRCRPDQTNRVLSHEGGLFKRLQCPILLVMEGLLISAQNRKCGMLLVSVSSTLYKIQISSLEKRVDDTLGLTLVICSFFTMPLPLVHIALETSADTSLEL